jgi:hypothetical protein
VLPAHADLAFELLRDQDALQRFLQDIQVEESTAAAPRLALALDAGESPPWLVVDRDGHGVTCLAAGMSTTEIQVPHAKVLGHVEAQRQIFRAQRALAQAGDPDDPAGAVQRAIRAPHRITPSEFELLRALAPFVAPFFARATGEEVENLRAWRRGRHAHKKIRDPESAWRQYLAVALGIAACGDDPAMLRANVLAAGHAGDAVLAGSAINKLMGHPEALIAFAQRVPHEVPALAPALLRVCLPVAALLQPGWARDLKRSMEALAKGPLAAHLPVFLNMMERNQTSSSRFAFLLVTHLPALFSRTCPPQVLNLEPDARKEVVSKIQQSAESGATLLEVAQTAGPWQAQCIAEWRPLEKVAVGVSEPETKALEWWREFFWDALFVMGGDAEREWMMPLLAAHAPAATFHPVADGKRHWSLNQGAEYMTGKLQTLLQQSALTEKPPPARRR